MFVTPVVYAIPEDGPLRTVMLRNPSDPDPQLCSRLDGAGAQRLLALHADRDAH